MKHYQLLVVVAVTASIVLSSCTTMWPVKMDNKDFTKIIDTKVSSLVLKKGDTVHFGYQGGKFIEKQRNDTLFADIVGYDTSDTKLLTIPLRDVQSVEGEHEQTSVILTILAILGGLFAATIVVAVIILHGMKVG